MSATATEQLARGSGLKMESDAVSAADSGQQSQLTAAVVLHEYSAAANPELPPIPAVAFPASLHLSGPSRVIHLDLSDRLGHTDYPATSPNLLASFVRILRGEAVETLARATSQAFYVIQGSGTSTSADHGAISWSTGDLFVLPSTSGPVTHSSAADAVTDASLYFISDEPLLRYLGVTPSEVRFPPTLYTREVLMAEVERIRHAPGADHRNRMGVLLSGTSMPETKTLTPTLWALLNTLPGKSRQPPHRHNSVALDLCVAATPGVYTLMGPELGADGWVLNPIKMEWSAGAMFTTPPGWWHSHHNDSDTTAWVLPMQDAGLYTRQRTLDIRFSPLTAEYNSLT